MADIIAPEIIERRRVIAFWLLAIAAMVFAMVVLGGVTRLTHSGLSIVDWKPLTGWLPPLTEAQWEAVFAEYRKFPEYRELNAGMTLAEFKGIFWLEYLHRLCGRLIGVVFFIPLAVFLVRGWVDRRLALKLGGIFVLGGLQAVVGWFMVKSGLVDRPDVSPYRLVAHLGLGLAIYTVLVWVALGLFSPNRRRAGLPRLRRFAFVLCGLIFLTALSGGFVAGTNAGFAYNTFPLMDGEWIPEHLFALQPLHLNFFEDVTTVQFTHRVLALTVVAAIAAFWIAARRASLASRSSIAVHLLLLAAIVQATLGISTLVLIVPIPLAALHQAGALALLTAALWTAFELTASPSHQVAAENESPETNNTVEINTQSPPAGIAVSRLSRPRFASTQSGAISLVKSALKNGCK